jgi:hypothetical protein
MAEAKTITKSVPVIPDAPKPEKTAKAKTPTMGRNEHAASIAATSPSGWTLLTSDVVPYPFKCVCNGHGGNGYIVVANGDLVDVIANPDAVAWVGREAEEHAAEVSAHYAEESERNAAIREAFANAPAWVKVGKTCLYHFGIAV